MKLMSDVVKRVVDHYGFICDINGHTVIVSSPNGVVVFRRVNSMRYRVYGDVD